MESGNFDAAVASGWVTGAILDYCAINILIEITPQIRIEYTIISACFAIELAFSPPFSLVDVLAVPVPMESTDRKMEQDKWEYHVTTDPI